MNTHVRKRDSSSSSSSVLVHRRMLNVAPYDPTSMLHRRVSNKALEHSVDTLNRLIFLFICACNIVQNAIVGGSNNAIMTTLETGFYMTSTETGLFQSVYEFMAMFTFPLVGYFGDRSRRKIRWIAISMAVLSCGSVVMSIPHLLELNRGRPPLDPQMFDHLTLCNPNRTISVCSYSSRLRFLSDLKYFFYLSNIINACGSAALPTLAVTLIEDLFGNEKAALAQGSIFHLDRKTKIRFRFCRNLFRCWWHRHWIGLSCHLSVSQGVHVHQEARLVNTTLFGMGRCLVACLCHWQLFEFDLVPHSVSSRSSTYTPFTCDQNIAFANCQSHLRSRNNNAPITQYVVNYHIAWHSVDASMRYPNELFEIERFLL
jgi:hypothetical protein